MTRLVCLIATREVIHLSTNVQWSNTWTAIDENTYDADYDYAAQCYVSSSPCGNGSVEQEAIDDLFDEILERSVCEKTKSVSKAG